MTGARALAGGPSWIVAEIKPGSGHLPFWRRRIVAEFKRRAPRPSSLSSSRGDRARVLAGGTSWIVAEFKRSPRPWSLSSSRFGSARCRLRRPTRRDRRRRRTSARTSGGSACACCTSDSGADAAGDRSGGRAPREMRRRLSGSWDPRGRSRADTESRRLPVPAGHRGRSGSVAPPRHGTDHSHPHHTPTTRGVGRGNVGGT